MLVRFFERDGWLDENITWSKISAFGNSPIAKLVAFAPIVAVYVKLQEQFLTEKFGLANAEWLYWSLMAIAAGQVLYLLLCPRIIKKYGDDVERHKIEALSSMPKFEFEQIRDRFFVALYRDGLSLKFPAGSAQADDKVIDALVAKDRALDPATISRYVKSYTAFSEKFLTNYMFARGGAVEYAVVADLMSRYPAMMFGDNKTPNSYVARSMALDLAQQSAVGETTGDNHDWHVSCLGWRYRVLNKRSRWAIGLVATMYVVGSLYFVWRAVDGAIFMLRMLVT